MPNWRGRGTSTGTISAMRPGRGDSTTTRSASITDSGIEWVTNSTVLGCSRQMRMSSRVSSSRVSASSELKGSSIRRMSGSCTSARQMPARICMPPDSSRGIFALEALEADELQQAPGAARTVARDALHHLEREQHVVEHARPRQQRRRLEDDAGLGARLRHRWPSMTTRPWVSGQQPAHQPQQRRLPAPRGPHEADELVAADRERDVRQRGDPIAVARDEVLRTFSISIIGASHVVEHPIPRCELRGCVCASV